MRYSTAVAKKVSSIMNPFPLTLAILLSVSFAKANDFALFSQWAIIILVSFVIAPIIYIYVKKKLLADNNGTLVQDPTAFFRIY